MRRRIINVATDIPSVFWHGGRSSSIIAAWRFLKRSVLAESPGFKSFDGHEAIQLNRARQDHLESLGLSLNNQTVLEVGAAVGWHTAFFEKRRCTVISTDARPENVAEHQRRYPHRQGRVKIADPMIPSSHDDLGQFDIVYCYRTLYHLSDPAMCIRELSKACRKLFLLETCVNSGDNGAINLVLEVTTDLNHSVHWVGCTPGRDSVMAELGKHFPCVYVTVTQPNHVEFPLVWPAALSRKVRNARAVFVASRQALNLPTLSAVLLKEQVAWKRNGR